MVKLITDFIVLQCSLVFCMSTEKTIEQLKLIGTKYDKGLYYPSHYDKRLQKVIKFYLDNKNNLDL